MSKKFIPIAILLLLLVGCDFLSKDKGDLILEVGNDNISLNEDWVDAGAYLSVDGEKIYAIASHDIDNSVTGEYIITYSLTHEETNYTAIRYVWVHDRENPVVKLNEGVDTIQINGIWTDAGVTSSDNYSAELTLVIEGSVDTSTAGTYTITYVVNDEAGNTTKVNRVITVLE